MSKKVFGSAWVQSTMPSATNFHLVCGNPILYLDLGDVCAVIFITALCIFFLVFLSGSVPGMHAIVLPSLLLPDGGQQHSSILQHGSSQQFLSQSVRYGETFKVS